MWSVPPSCGRMCTTVAFTVVDTDSVAGYVLLLGRSTDTGAVY
jgi:hypothetical protein